MWNRNVETFLGCDDAYEDAHIVLFGAPFDSTTSYRPGTRFAARTMRAESYGLETYSPYQDLDLEDARVFDGGDLELPFGDTARALGMIRDFAAEVLADGKLPLLIGGEHLVSLPAIEAAAEKYPDLAVIHFDAHTDLRDEYLGNRLSHATVIRRVWDILGDGRIHQFGIRSGERAEWQWARAGHTNLRPFTFAGLSEAVAAVRDPWLPDRRLRYGRALAPARRERRVHCDRAQTPARDAARVRGGFYSPADGVVCCYSQRCAMSIYPKMLMAQCFFYGVLPIGGMKKCTQSVIAPRRWRRSPFDTTQKISCGTVSLCPCRRHGDRHR